ncbi:YveK family protein [Salimicrobium halophilum]|uniref:Capsular polysaccharide biosynthesis protein n=1 Tax=Salimicrobium halophilum TaxID=86666 RepID=A0A1G8SD41_9BACI|nr:Wzz/FepE/Etk N-terminal domain-containing protein [Salimicrobium halophilum]SDJ26600.1 Capsular polysaccharide biosynthesis protein [Salimicrobium halophilum]
MNERMDVHNFISTLKRRYITILAVMISMLMLSVVVSFYVMKPTYEGNENIVIGSLNTNESYSETQQLNMLLASTIDFIKSPSVLSVVTRESGLSYEEINDKMIIRNTKDSQIINVIVRDQDPVRAEQVAGLIATTTVDKMNSLFGVADIVVLNNPEDNSQVQQVGGFVLNIGIGIVVGLLAGIGVAMFRDHMDDSLQSSKEIETLIGVPLLGEIDMKKKRKGRFRTPRIEVEKEEDIGVIEGEKRGEISV